jgi:hypothetical protein
MRVLSRRYLHLGARALVVAAVVACGAGYGCGGAQSGPRAQSASGGLQPPTPSRQTCAPGSAAPPIVQPQWSPVSLPYPLNLSYEQLRPLLAQLPCPLPGLPAELAAKVDCSITRQRPGAARYMPLMLPPWNYTVVVDHRAAGIAGPVRDQQRTGSCFSNGLASFLDSYARRRGRVDLLASPLHMFSRYASQPDNTDYRGVRDDKVVGVTTESIWPYTGGKACSLALNARVASGCGSEYRMQAGWGTRDPQVLGERAYADAHPAFWIKVDLNSFPVDDPSTGDEIAKSVLAGEAVQIGFDMPINWSSTQVAVGCDGTLPAPVGFYGTHALVVQGVRGTPRGRQFLVQNSWGREWADNGFGWIDDSVFKARLANVHRYQVALAGDAGFDPRIPPLTPIGSMSGAASTCPPSMTSQNGRCVPAFLTCPAGTHLSNGVCVPNGMMLPAIPVCAAGQWPTFAAPCQLSGR